ncbi:MAG: ABC transporter permease [Xenophilus sp.]
MDVIANGKLFAAVGVSGLRLGVGFALGSVLGVALGLCAGLWRHGDELLDGTLQALRAIPFLALAPLFNLWFSNGEAAKVLLVGFGATFPLYLSTTAGIRAVDARLLEAAKVSGLARWERIREVILPGALPQILTGLRIGFGWALAALVSAELTKAASGIGALVAEAREFVQTDLLFVCAVTYALLGLAADGALRLAAARLLRWRRAYEGK